MALQISSNTAHIIIDVQEDFCIDPRRPEMMKSIEEMLPSLNYFYKQLKEKHVLTIFTKFISSEEISPRNMQSFFKETHGAFRPLCKAGTKKADIYFLKPHDDDSILEKQYYDAFTNPQLNKILKQNHIQNIIISGIRTEVCILATAERAFSEGYTVIVAEDLVGTPKGTVIHEQALEIMRQNFAFVKKHNEILNLLS